MEFRNLFRLEWNSAREMKGEWTRRSTSFNGYGSEFAKEHGGTQKLGEQRYSSHESKSLHQSAMAETCWNNISEQIINSFLGGFFCQKKQPLMFHLFFVRSVQAKIRMALSLRPTSLPWTCVLSTFGVPAAVAQSIGRMPSYTMGTSEALTWKVPSNQTQWQPEIAWELVMLCWFCCFFESPCIDVFYRYYFLNSWSLVF